MNSIENHIKNYIRTGDRKWFAMIYEETMPRIYRYYYFKTMERELSEDFTSEVFIKVYSNLRNTSLNGKSYITWLYRIAHNLLIDHFRKNKGMEVPLEQVIDSIKVYDENILMKESAYLRKELGLENPELVLALNSLTGLQKDVIILRFVEDMDYGTIAGIFKKSKGTIRGIVFRAVEKIRKEMAGNDE